MIAGILHEGSGLGDQLFRYITVRSLAEKKGFDWFMDCGELNLDAFKGRGFMRIQYWSSPSKNNKEETCISITNPSYLKRFEEKKVIENGVDIRSYDPEINFVEDDTIIDGSFEDDKYWRHNLKNINEWLKVEKLDISDEICIIGFRGGEYSDIRELFLPKEYWDTAIAQMRLINPNMRFQVHTDDPELAKQFFLDFEIVENTPISHSKHTNMGLNWRSARFAKYAIIPNSAFFIIPRILKHYEEPTAITLAPRYWARRNTKIWARPACYYPEFTYV